MPANKRIAVWMSEKKLQKINWDAFVAACSNHGFEVFNLDSNKSIEEQGPFSVLLQKRSDIIASATQGDIKSTEILNQLENYLRENPSIIVLDPIPNVRRLLDRYNCYSIIDSTDLHSYGIFTPNFCVLRNEDVDIIKDDLRKSRVSYPLICKPILGHGSRQAHEMSIIFDEKYLLDCKTPCVAQSFINHNAILYKIFIVGDKHCVVERPSLKNFQASQRESIYFESGDVSRANSRSMLTVLDPDDIVSERWEPDNEIIELIVTTLRQSFCMDLLGVDVVIEKSSGRYAIIDVNAYPGYDGFPNFYGALLQCISEKVTLD